MPLFDGPVTPSIACIARRFDASVADTLTSDPRTDPLTIQAAGTHSLPLAVTVCPGGDLPETLGLRNLNPFSGALSFLEALGLGGSASGQLFPTAPARFHERASLFAWLRLGGKRIRLGV